MIGVNGKHIIKIIWGHFIQSALGIESFKFESWK
jgi:hypothetical protein